MHVILFNKLRNTYHYALHKDVMIVNTRQEINHILLVLNEAGMTYILRCRTQRLGVHSVIDGGGTRLETLTIHSVVIFTISSSNYKHLSIRHDNSSVKSPTEYHNDRNNVKESQGHGWSLLVK